MSHRYREELRRRATHDDAAFIEYMADLVVPAHLREMSLFATRHRHAVVLEPRGFGKTTLLCYRAARLVGLASGAIRIGILCAVDEDAENLTAAVRRIVEHPRFAEIFPWAAAGVEGPRWRDGAWTVRGVELGKDVTCRALSLGSVHAGPRLDLLFADDPVGLQENATPAGRAKVLETLLEVVLPMLVPDGRLLVTGTRWHDDDLYAYLLRQGWPSIVRQAIEAGVPLWAARFSLEELAARRTLMGTPLYNLQYMNDPSGMGGNVFRRAWFTKIDVVPAGISRRVGVDLAASLAERADYTAVVEIVETADHTLVIVGAWHERLADGHRAWLTGLTDALGPAVGRPYGPPVGPRLCQPLGMLPPLFAGATGDPALARRLSAVNIETTAFQTVFAHELMRHTGLRVHKVQPDATGSPGHGRSRRGWRQAGWCSGLGPRASLNSRTSSSRSPTAPTTTWSTPPSTPPISERRCSTRSHSRAVLGFARCAAARGHRVGRPSPPWVAPGASAGASRTRRRRRQ